MSMTAMQTQLGWTRLWLTMQATAAPLPQEQWLNSALRGAFGNALLRHFCPEQQFHCNTCAHPCSTGVLFDTGHPDQSAEAVNPYIIDCPSAALQGNILQFGLTFFANGLAVAPDVLLALQDGIVLGATRTPFQLCAVVDADTQTPISTNIPLSTLPVHYLRVEAPAARYRIQFVTPCRSKLPHTAFGFPQLMRAILRRVSTAMRQADILPDFDYTALLAQAEQMITESRSLHPFQQTRYSSRTDSRWSVTGFTGEMIVSGDFTNFLPLLRMAEVLHVGKMCVMGLGKIAVSAC